MKKTQIIELLNTIKRTAVSFVAILMFVTMGVALYTGLGWSASALERSANYDYDDYCFRDLDVYFAYGIDDDGLAAIKAIDGVDLAEGVCNTYPFFYKDGIKKQAKVVTATEQIDRFSYIDGTFPTGISEIAVERHWAEANGVSIGDTITFDHDDDGSAHLLRYALDKRYFALLNPKPTEDGMKYLYADTFIVTALVSSPAYMSVIPFTYGVSSVTSTPIDCIMFVNAEAFDKDAYLGYSDVLIYSSALSGGLTSSDKYKEGVQALKERVLPVANRLQNKRYKEIKEALKPVLEWQFVPQEMKDMIAQVKDYDSIVFTRANNGGQVAISSIADVFVNIRYSMVAMFVVIGLLVCYTAVSRIVYEQSVLIGAKKALGLNNREITRSYLLYTCSAVLMGLVLGLGLGYLIEFGLLSAVAVNYVITKMAYSFSLFDALLIGSTELGLILLSSLIACRNILRRDVVSLLTGNDEKVYKPKKIEKTALWKRMPVWNKAIFNNFFNDKRRIFSTLVSIAGCTALVVCALGFSNGISESFDTQFNKIQTFDALIYYDHAVEGAAEDIEKIVRENGYDYTQSYMSIGSLRTEQNDTSPSYLFTFDASVEKLFDMYDLDGVKQEYSDDGDVWISAAYATEYGLQKGDKVYYLDARGREVEITIGGLYQYYLQHTQLLMTPAVYERIFGEVPPYNVFVVDSDFTGLAQLQGELSKIDGYILTEDFFISSQKTFEVVELVCNAVTAVYLILSICMALLVLLNLFTMYIQEKKRELIVLMVNGFSKKDAKRYIYMDSVILTLLGMVFGGGAGLLIARLSLMTLMTDSTYPLMTISWSACGIGAAVSVVLTVCMCLIALRRIDKFKLTDINTI